MSAPTQTIEIKTSERSGDFLRAMVSRLFFKRLLRREGTLLLLTFAVVLGLLCLTGAIDYARPLTRALRIIIAISLALAALVMTFRAFWKLLRQRRFVEMAREIERVTGKQQNALVAYAESTEENRFETPSYMLTRLEAQSRSQLNEIDERVVAPRAALLRSAIALAIVLFLILALRLFAPAAFAQEAQRLLFLSRDDPRAQGISTNNNEANGAHEDSVMTIQGVRIRVIPPAYSGLSAEEVQGDAPVRALAGSQVEVSINVMGRAAGATLSFNGASSNMHALGGGLFQSSFLANTSGAFEARVLSNEQDLLPAPLVRAVEVYADAPPEVHITEPASDQLLSTVPSAPVRMRFAARDDLGIAGLTLKYIKSRGEGDAAKFTDGELQLGEIERVSAREWRGVTALDLARLDMRAGDTLVFWIEARDRNPNTNNMGRSANLAIAIKGPEAVKLDLSDLRPNEIGRFRLSQRLILMHTEKLHAERARLDRTEFMRRANDIAAEQRDFRNSFNEYISAEGEEHLADSGSSASIEDEVQASVNEQTEVHVHNIPEPPAGAPASVRELTYAIRAMWDAEAALSEGDTTKALVHEREALTRLKRAQTASRYIPPIIARHKPIDLKRRYAGELTEIKTRLEKLNRRPVSKDAGALRAALADAYSALGDLQSTLGVPVNARASALGRARERTRQAADRLMKVGGDHAVSVAEAAGQLRIVETELARTDTGGTSEEFAARISKSLSLLTQAASSLFAIAESSTRAGISETNSLLPADNERASQYFRRLAEGTRP